MMCCWLQVHGVDWDRLAQEIPTKEKTQIKNYYQNYKQRLGLDQIELPQGAKHPKATRGRGQGACDTSRASTSRPGQASLLAALSLGVADGPLSSSGLSSAAKSLCFC